MGNQQEAAWKGEFGDHYTDRNQGRVPANRHFFRKALDKARASITTVLELGCGSGENLTALRQLMPNAHLEGIEINPKAAAIAKERGHLAREISLQDYYLSGHRQFDLVFTKGVLIHIPPAELATAYALLVESSTRWVLVAEYYSPRREEIVYRGKHELLWKADFAGELLAAYPELHLVDYGFVYHRDPYPQDDLTFFLLEKRQ